MMEIELQLPAPSLDATTQVCDRVSGFPYTCTAECVGSTLLALTNPEVVKAQSATVAVVEAPRGNHDAEAAMRSALAGSEDYYEILGLKKLRMKATQDDIRLAFRDLCVKMHPDQLKSVLVAAQKQRGDDSDEEEEAEDAIFKKLTAAYETLRDPQFRRVYDSREGPAVRLPPLEGDFYANFGPAFARTAHWSERTPVPVLGTDGTSDEDVDSFYSFWFQFVSWRDWSFEAEHDVQKAEGREEKRWMERENQRIAQKKKREEMNRIIQLVETAYKLDPRLKRRRENEKAAKERERTAKRDAARLAELEAKQKEEADAKRKATEAESAKKDKERTKRELRRLKKRVKDAAAAGFGVDLDATLLENLFNRLSVDDMMPLVESLSHGDENPIREAMGAARKEVTEAEAAAQVARAAAAAAAEEAKREAKRQEAAQHKPWTLEEEGLLSKANQRFPGGTPNRWERMSEYMRTRTPKEIQEMTQLLRQGVRPSQLGLHKSTPVIAKSGALDAESVDYERMARAAEAQPVASASVAPVSATIAAAPTSPATAPVKASAEAVAAVPHADGSATESVWTAQQQAHLEEGLRKHPASDPHRWEHIAAMVEGKSVRECMLRFKEIVARVKAAKVAKEAAKQAATAPAASKS